MVDPNKLLDQLNKLLDCQWEELIFRLDIDEAHLRATVTQSQRNIDLIRLFNQQENGLQILQDTLYRVIGTRPANDFFLFSDNLSEMDTEYPLQKVQQILQQFNDLNTIRQAYRNSLPADASLSRPEVVHYQDMVAQLREFRRLPEFIHRLIQDEQVPPVIRDPLKDILQQLCQTEGWQQPTEFATSIPEILQSCLQIVLCPENKPGQLRVNAWLIPDDTVLDSVNRFIPLDLDEQRKGTSCTIEEVPKVVEQFLKLTLDSLYGKRHVLTIEIFLPIKYLCFDVDGWVLSEDLGFTTETFVLGRKYRVIVRSQERLHRNYLRSKWTQWLDNWDRVKTRLDTTPHENDFEHLSQFESCNWNHLVRSLKQKLGLKLTCGLVEAHQEDLFTSILIAATPIAIWTRCNLPHLDSISAINQLIRSGTLLDLSETIRKTRELASITEVPKEHLGCHLAILWEDPNRLTPDVGNQFIQVGQ